MELNAFTIIVSLLYIISIIYIFLSLDYMFFSISLALNTWCIINFINFIRAPSIISAIVGLLPILFILLLMTLFFLYEIWYKTHGKFIKKRKIIEGDYKKPQGWKRESIPKIYTQIDNKTIEILLRPGIKNKLNESSEKFEIISELSPLTKIARVKFKENVSLIEKREMSFLNRFYKLSQTDFKKAINHWYEYSQKWCKEIQTTINGGDKDICS